MRGGISAPLKRATSPRGLRGYRFKAQSLLGALVLFAIAAAAVTEASNAAPKLGTAAGSGAITPVGASGARSDCPDISFTKDVRYGSEKMNVLDVASSVTSPGSYPSAVLLFVAGESFTEPVGSGMSGALLEQAMCLAARNNLVAVKMSYRLAPKDRWPAAARDVAAAVSWIRDNIDLFGGDRNRIIAIGYSVGAFHLASSVAHPELRVAHSNLAGIVLLSGLYRIGTHSSPAVKAYIGNDPAKYRHLSIFPGILFANDPLLLAWSVNDSRHVVTESEELKALMCEARRGICPHHAVLRGEGSVASIIDLLGEPVQSLIRQVEARGLP